MHKREISPIQEGHFMRFMASIQGIEEVFIDVLYVR